MKIVFCGGGSLGPVTPLIAVLKQMKHIQPRATFVWVGTPNGPERQFVEAEGVSFYTIPVAKLPRYVCLDLLLFPVKYLASEKAARILLEQEKPDLVVSVGGFTAVPVMRVAARLGIMCALHQLDYQPGLTNKGVASLCASVTTSFAYAHPPFGRSVATVQVPTPCRFSTGEPVSNVPTRHTILVMGGGTGAKAINDAIAEILDELLVHADVIHATGIGKAEYATARTGYYPSELLNEKEMLLAYTKADIVISRAGLGALSECAALHKATIMIPIPHSQQEENVRALEEGIVHLDQAHQGFAQELKSTVFGLLEDASRQAALGNMLHKLLPTDNGTTLAVRWLDLIQKYP